MKLKKNECALVIGEGGEINQIFLPNNLDKYDFVSYGMMVVMALLQLSKKKNKVFRELIEKEVRSICRKYKIKTRAAKPAPR